MVWDRNVYFQTYCETDCHIIFITIISDLYSQGLLTKGYGLVSLTCVSMATHFNWISLQSEIKKKSLFCLSIMIFTDFMGMYGKKYQPLRLSTNSAETRAVWLLVTLYFYVDFDNLFCLRAAVKQRKYFCMKWGPPHSFIHLWIHFHCLKAWQPLLKSTRAIFEKCCHVPN